MSIAKTYSAQLVGLSPETVIIEVDISHGLHAFSVVGLGDRAVDEAKDRISAAIKNSGYTSPKQKNQKVVISLAPADVRKEGTSFDLAMTLAYLKATGDVDFDSEHILFFGELSLSGNIRRVSGLLPILCRAQLSGFKQAFVPKDNISEASLARDIAVYGVSSLAEIIAHLDNTRRLDPISPRPDYVSPQPVYPDMRLVRGNETAKRGLEIAAAGAHNVMMYGPPGTGKTMLANCFPSLLPQLSYEQSVEVTGIHSAAHTLDNGLITYPPFRAPHHTASYPSIVGGGSFPKPGEITLAHRGVLFMDEFPEFDRSVIEALRQPLEEHTITISRARGTVCFPAQTILLASMNPCPCGKSGRDICTCPAHIAEAYRRKISGPIMDRFDIWLDISRIDYASLATTTVTSESSSEVSAHVTKARQIQYARFKQYDINKSFNSEMSARDLETCVVMEDTARAILTRSAERFNFSGRAFHRVIKVARTIADLANIEKINQDHVLEALQYRRKNF